MGIPARGKGIHKHKKMPAFHSPPPCLLPGEPRGRPVTRVGEPQTPAQVMAGRAAAMRRPGLNRQLHVRVTSAQHRRKTGGFLFPPPFLARLFKVPMASHRAQSPLAVELLLEPPQGLFHGLAFLQFYLGQNTFTSSPATWNPQAQRAGAPSSVRPNSLRLARGLSTGKKRQKTGKKRGGEPGKRKGAGSLKLAISPGAVYGTAMAGG